MHGTEGAEFGHADLIVREDLQQEGFELFVGSIDFVDEQDRRARAGMADGLHERALKQKLAAEDRSIEFGTTCRVSLSEANMQDLTRVVPFIQRCARVQTLIALQADKGGVERAGQHLGDLGLADARFALQQDGLTEIKGQLGGQAQGAVGHVIVGIESSGDVLDAVKGMLPGARRSHDVPRRSINGKAPPRRATRAGGQGSAARFILADSILSTSSQPGSPWPTPNAACA